MGRVLGHEVSTGSTLDARISTWKDFLQGFHIGEQASGYLWLETAAETTTLLQPGMSTEAGIQCCL